jgi:predicted GNAT superfamily acetyltransferase
MALREALLSAFETGYRIVDFARDGVRCWYVLRPDTA